MTQLSNKMGNLLCKQKEFFNLGLTRNIEFRKEQLIKFKNAIIKFENEIRLSLKKDLGKPDEEILMTEIGVVIGEINYALNNLKRWITPEIKSTITENSLGESKIIKEPYGVILIIGPWNYPFQLVMGPLVGAIAGGNCAIVKPSEISTNVEKVILKLINETFNNDYISVVTGGVEETSELLEQEFDKIFFTGSPKVGKIVMKYAAENLIPVILELGGKSPCIVDNTCDLKVAAKRILSGKGLNAGQTCIAPDYLIIHESCKLKFYQEFKNAVEEFYGIDLQNNKNYGKIINLEHFNRIISYLKEGNIIFGGKFNAKYLHIDLTLLEVSSFGDKVMEEEIFGPILPVVTYKDNEEIPKIIAKNPNPLALYVFSNNKSFVDWILNMIRFGGGCVNDTVMHVIDPQLPFGGRGKSGIGRYHGEYNFQAFTHEKAILERTLEDDGISGLLTHKKENIKTNQ